MIDGLDGFQLTPSQAAVTRMRFLGYALVASSTFVVVMFAVFALTIGPPVWWVAAAVYLVLSVPADWILWRVMQPPTLKSDGTTVTCKSGFRTIAIACSDLAGIHLGQAPRGPGRTSSVRSYVFTNAEESALFTVPAMWFPQEEMRAFGDRLDVQLSERP